MMPQESVEKVTTSNKLSFLWKNEAQQDLGWDCHLITFSLSSSQWWLTLKLEKPISPPNGTTVGSTNFWGHFSKWKFSCLFFPAQVLFFNTFLKLIHNSQSEHVPTAHNSYRFSWRFTSLPKCLLTKQEVTTSPFSSSFKDTEKNNLSIWQLEAPPLLWQQTCLS